MDEGQSKQVLAQVDELVRLWLAQADEWWPEGFRLREIGIVYDVELPGKNIEVVSISTSVDAEWAKAGLFRAAMQVADWVEDD